MSNYNEASKIITSCLLVMVISTLFISVDTLAKPFQDLAIEQKINEKVLSQNYQTSFESAENANLELDIYFNEIEQLNALEYLAVQENQIDLSYANSDARSRNAAIKIQKIIYKYISSHFGPQYNPTTLTETQFLQLEGFVESNKKVNDLYACSIATRCALRYSGGISMRRYGWSNMNAIIGHGRLTICGVFSINTGILRDQIRFY